VVLFFVATNQGWGAAQMNASR